MQPPKSASKSPLRERNHLPRKRAVVTGEIFGIRPLYLAVTALAAFALLWFFYGWWTYPVTP
jgi:hypothetical protein